MFFFLIALRPIFYTQGMTPKEHMKNIKPFGMRLTLHLGVGLMKHPIYSSD